jgi:hypothetical protein
MRLTFKQLDRPVKYLCLTGLGLVALGLMVAATLPPTWFLYHKLSGVPELRGDDLANLLETLRLLWYWVMPTLAVILLAVAWQILWFVFSPPASGKPDASCNDSRGGPQS